MTPSRGIGKTVHSADQTAFCALMIAARKSAGLTQHALARRLGRPQSFVAKYEGGERRLDVVEFVAVIQAIGADPVRLLRDLVAGKLPPRTRKNSAR
jgi:transcriptional regulator with XRE-family HTH domain